MEDHSVHHSVAKNNKPKPEPSVMGWANASTPVGDKALQYSDLKSLHPQPDTREPTQRFSDSSRRNHGALFMDHEWQKIQ